MEEERIIKRRPRVLPEIPEEVELPIIKPAPLPARISTPDPLVDPPEWYPIAMEQVNRVFGEYVYRSLHKIAGSSDWSDEALTVFQGDTARGVELRDLMIHKLQGVAAFQALSITTESGDAVQRVQPQAGKLSSGRRDEASVASPVRSARREF